MMFKLFFLWLFCSHEVQAKEPPKLAGDELVTESFWIASAAPPSLLVGSYLIVAGALADDVYIAPGILTTGFGVYGVVGGPAMMSHGNRAMIRDLKSKGGSVEQSALRWSHGFTAAYLVTAIGFWVPEIVYNSDAMFAANGLVCLTSYIGAVVSGRVQQKRTRQAFQSLTNKHSFRTKRNHFTMRPVFGYRSAGLTGQF